MKGIKIWIEVLLFIGCMLSVVGSLGSAFSLIPPTERANIVTTFMVSAMFSFFLFILLILEFFGKDEG